MYIESQVAKYDVYLVKHDIVFGTSDAKNFNVMKIYYVKC